MQWNITQQYIKLKNELLMHMVKCQKLHIEWKKPDPKSLHDPIYMKFKTGQTN